MAIRRPEVSRGDLIGAAYAEHAERLHRDLSRRSQQQHRDLVDDAFSYAWQRLVVRTDIELDPDRAFLGWVYVAALREQRKLIVERGRELSLDGSSIMPRPILLIHLKVAVRTAEKEMSAAFGHRGSKQRDIACAEKARDDRRARDGW